MAKATPKGTPVDEPPAAPTPPTPLTLRDRAQLAAEAGAEIVARVEIPVLGLMGFRRITTIHRQQIRAVGYNRNGFPVDSKLYPALFTAVCVDPESGAYVWRQPDPLVPTEIPDEALILSLDSAITDAMRNPALEAANLAVAGLVALGEGFSTIQHADGSLDTPET